jgi:alpha-beta hydrolase superfamily lysophospholipase
VAPRTCVRTRRFDAFYHEIMNEPGASQVFEEIAVWLDDVASAPP